MGNPISDAILCKSVFGVFTPLQKVVWSEKITDEFLRASGVSPNAATVDLIVKVSDPTSVTDNNDYGVGYESAATVEKGEQKLRDGKTYALRGVTVRKGDTLFMAGDMYAASVQVSVEKAGAILPEEDKQKSTGEAFGENLGKSLGTGTIILIGALILFGQAKKAVIG